MEKSYSVDAWDHEGGSSAWYGMQLGTLHYKTDSNVQSAGFGYRVANWNPRTVEAHAVNGWDNVERAEINPVAYHGLIKAYTSEEPDDKWQGVYLSALSLVFAHAERDDLPVILGLNPQLERKKLVRVVGSTRDTYIEDFVECLVLTNEIFDNALDAYKDMSIAEKMRFIDEIMQLFGSKLSQQNSHSYRDYLIRMVLHIYPEKANHATASLVVGSLDFTNDAKGQKAWNTIYAAFGPDGYAAMESLELPANFDS